MENDRQKYTFGYEFDFWLTVRKHNGKLYKDHHKIGLGLNFNLALWDVYHSLKKRRSQIMAINRVRPLRITFAFGKDQQSFKLRLTDHPPEIPHDLETELNKLPKQ